MGGVWRIFLGISFGSINTGLPKDIVQQLIAAERIPLQKMEVRKGMLGDKQQLVTELTGLLVSIKGDISANNDARRLRELTVETNTDIIGVALDKDIAQPGIHQLEVLQLAQKSTAMSSGFADKDDSYVGVGYIQYTLPNGENRDLYVDSDSSSLTGIAKLINSDSENGMSAKVVNDGSESDTPWKIIISIDDTGDMNKADFPFFYFVDGEQDFYLEAERPAQDAKIRIDGFEIETPTNKVSDLIPGVTIDLKKASPGEEFSLTIKEDTEAITGKISLVIEKINDVLNFIRKQNALDENTDTRRTLGGELILQTLESRFRTSVFQAINTTKGTKRLSDLGVTFQRNGTLKLDEDKFNAAVSADYQNTAEILTGRINEEGRPLPGFINHLETTIKFALQYPNGLLVSKKKNIESSMKDIDRRIENRERLISQKEKGLKEKFARLESTISRIKNQGAGLAGLSQGNQASAVNLG
jgi:flagellar hook-associated protein 2